MSTPSRFLELNAGRRIALDEFGAPDGEPVFLCHGWPGSRRMAAGLDDAARACGVRLLSPDRPGVGLSTAQPGRTLRDWPALLGEIATQLGLEKFRVIGVSGGGPYALVAAWAMPERVLAAACVCGAPPLAESASTSGLHPLYRTLIGLYRWRRGALRTLFRVARPFATVRPPDWLWPHLLRFFPKPDAETLRDPTTFNICWENQRDAWLGGADGVFADAEIYALPWGFAPEEIRVPVRLWHGKQDRNFSWLLAERLAHRIPGCAVRMVDDEGHQSLPFRCTEEILRDLRGA